MDVKRFQDEGFNVVEALVSTSDIETWLPELEAFREQAGGGHSVRNLAELPLVREIARSKPVTEVVHPILSKPASLVRAILFDKVAGANWTVPWHQDLTIAVAERHDLEGYGPWSVKDGVVHVRPPVSVLEQMVTVRIHLDRCGVDNGPVRVVPGSHLFGQIPESRIAEYLVSEVSCTGDAGSALVMRPLILHASSPAANPHHRRVLHLEFAACSLPEPLRWHTDRF